MLPLVTVRTTGPAGVWATVVVVVVVVVVVSVVVELQDYMMIIAARNTPRPNHVTSFFNLFLHFIIYIYFYLLLI